MGIQGQENQVLKQVEEAGEEGVQEEQEGEVEEGSPVEWTVPSYSPGLD